MGQWFHAPGNQNRKVKTMFLTEVSIVRPHIDGSHQLIALSRVLLIWLPERIVTKIRSEEPYGHQEDNHGNMTKELALVAHDNMKHDLVRWAKYNRESLGHTTSLCHRHDRQDTGAGSLVFKITKFNSGPIGR